MPLLDHFHLPLSGRRHSESFHSQWASCIASALNDELPEDYFAEAQVHAGPRIEVDVVTWHEPSTESGVATQSQTRPIMAPADMVLPATFPPEFAVHVYETSGGPTLVAAIELVSPANKDRPETRSAFAVKCAAYIQRGLGLIVVDIVTNRSSSPFAELLALIHPGQPAPATSPLLAVSYVPVRNSDGDTLEIRHRPLALGGLLPELPLALGGFGHITVNFETTYEEARHRSRL
jgi:hypothetical protein